MIDRRIHEILRGEYNPEGSKLRIYQLQLLEMLSDFDKICREAGVVYWLSSGTLLGAVRHEGFIPWDDDIDVEMTRKDCRRLLKFFKGNDKYVIQTQWNDSYYFWPFPKFRKKNVIINEATGVDKHYKYRGNYIDIFIIEDRYNFLVEFMSLPARLMYKLSVKKMNVVERLLFFLTKYSTMSLGSLVRFITNPFGGKTFGFSYGTVFTLANRRKEEIFPIGEIKFENRTFMAPKDSDAYLKRIFSDYMTIPDVKETHLK